VFHAEVRRRALTTALGPHPRPDLRLTTDQSTLLALARGELRPREALRRGKLALEGDVEDLEAQLGVFG
jgi:putative sterol carrier protein